MLHDLRKLFASVGENLGLSSAILRRLLNQVAIRSDTLHRHYVHLTVGDVKAPLEGLQNAIFSLTTPHETDMNTKLPTKLPTKAIALPTSGV